MYARSTVERERGYCLLLAGKHRARQAATQDMPRGPHKRQRPPWHDRLVSRRQIWGTNSGSTTMEAVSGMSLGGCPSI